MSSEYVVALYTMGSFREFVTDPVTLEEAREFVADPPRPWHPLRPQDSLRVFELEVVDGD